MVSFYDEIERNKRMTLLLFISFFILYAILGLAIGYIIGIGWWGLLLAILISIPYVVVCYFHGSSIILSLSGAREVKKEEYPYLFHTIEGLSIAAGIPTPKAYVINDSAPNAFATGKDPQHACIVVTTGLLEKMNRQELEGVIAHEMSHIKNYDMRTMMLAAVMVGVVALLSDLIIRMVFQRRRWGVKGKGRTAMMAVVLVGIALAILSPLIAQIIKFAISREREYLADATAIQLTRYPYGLASALKKISDDKEELKAANNATAHLYIFNPLKKGF